MIKKYDYEIRYFLSLNLYVDGIVMVLVWYVLEIFVNNFKRSYVNEWYI